MSYQIYLVKNDNYGSKNFAAKLENEKQLSKFTKEQIDKVKSKLQRYKYIISENNELETIFFWINKQTGVTARLNEYLVAFSSGTDEEGLFEIMQTTSEFVDDFLVKYDIQTGEWEKS